MSYFKLFPREQQIAKMLACGLPDKEIAYRLGLSVSTVRTYHKNIKKKTEEESTIGIARLLHREGILDHEKWANGDHAFSNNVQSMSRPNLPNIGGAFRGLLYGAPIYLTLWALILWALGVF
jgi:DNA-binding CsgD family transcriptional regulator